MNTGPRARLRIKGRLLAAAPGLRDGNFNQSIVYIARHDERMGSFGFIVNRPLNSTLGEIAQKPAEIPPPLGSVPVFWGGPVHQDSINVVVFRAVARSRAFSAILNMPFDQVCTHLGRKDSVVAGFVGVSSWQGSQLRGEMAEGSWILTDTDWCLLDVDLMQNAWPTLASGDERWRALIKHVRMPEGGN